MELKSLPFNIDLLIPTEENLKGMDQIKVLDVFEGSNKNFHPEGLFSTEIFGKVGDNLRNSTFSFIDLKMDLLHPFIFKILTSMRIFYGDIMSSKKYAIFDNKLKDFVLATPEDGETGFNFFIKNLPSLEVIVGNSKNRIFYKEILKKYNNKTTINKIPVIPAGLRDYVIDEVGKPTEDEINSIYRKILCMADLSDNVNLTNNEDYLDITRYNLQLTIGELYTYCISLLEGKHKLILGKWASRRIFNSSANVLSSYPHKSDHSEGVTSVSTHQTAVGLFQYTKCILPLALNKLTSNFLSEILIGPNSPANLINKKTLKKELIDIDGDTYDKWMTFEGLEKVIEDFSVEHTRHDYIEIKDHYLGLVFKGEIGGVKVFRLLKDIDDLPDDLDKKDVKPLTMAELIYITVYEGSSEIPFLVTRYPITSYGSIYPTYAYLKTTSVSEIRMKLTEDWKVGDSEANEYPIEGGSFYNSLGVASKHLARLGADFDGDVASFNSVLSEEGKTEIHRKIHDKNFYISDHNDMFFDSSTGVIDLVLSNMTSDVPE